MWYSCNTCSVLPGLVQKYSYFNRGRHNGLPTRNLEYKICLSYRKTNFKQVLFMSVLYVSALFSSYKALKSFYAGSTIMIFFEVED